MKNNTWAGYTTRYRCYCLMHGYTSPQEAIVADRKKWPGGVMTGFIDWIGKQWSAWRVENGYSPTEPVLKSGHEDFDKWLEQRSNAAAT